MYWRLKSVPELRDFPPKVRARLFRKALNIPFRPIDFLWLLLILAPVAPMAWLIFRLDKKPVPHWFFPISFFATIVVWQLSMRAVHIQRARPELRRLIESGEASLTQPTTPTFLTSLWVLGAACWMLAASMFMGKYLDMHGQTWQAIVFGAVLFTTGAICFFLAGRSNWRDRQQTYRQSNGLCPHCGYDLRATPGRCPECGK
jgi:hypothetical protein